MTLNMFATTDEVMPVNLVYFNTFRNSVKKDKKGCGEKKKHLRFSN